MTKFSTFFLSFFFSLTVFAVQKVTLDQVTQKVKSQNLTVLQNAEKVYQAKVSIDEARLNLLPRLNLWNVGRVILEPTALLDVIQDVAPFLVPANWFRMKETELLYKAELEGYRALQANEIYAARSLYVKVLMDQMMYQNLKEYAEQLAQLNSLAEDRLSLGLERADVIREIQIQYLRIQEDVNQIKILVDHEKRILSQALGYPAHIEIELTEIELPSEEKMPRINPSDWEAVALKNSPEIKQYDHFLKVIPQIKKEISFAFLGVPSLSRGTAGGIFDRLPVSQGLGFATGKQITIVKSQAKILQLQKQGIEETLKRQILNVAQIQNTSLDNYPSQKKRYSLSKENYEAMKQRLSLGGQTPLLEISTTLLSLSQAYPPYAQATYRLFINVDMLSRLTLTGPYADIKDSKK